jgi:hypothetical protein
MKTILTVFGAVALTVGLMAMAGSAGDCDGACGPGNDLATMLIVAGYGFVAFVGGAACLFAAQKL